MKFVGFNEWVKPFEAAVKARPGVKLTNKNRARLNAIYMRWVMDTYGESLDVLFKAVYWDAVQAAVLTPRSSLFAQSVSGGAWGCSVFFAPLKAKD